MDLSSLPDAIVERVACLLQVLLLSHAHDVVLHVARCGASLHSSDDASYSRGRR
jgi:hypothetical protein